MVRQRPPGTEVEEHKVWVGGLPSDVREEEVEKEFSYIGKVEKVFLKSTAKDTFAFVTFCDSDAYEKALAEMDGSTAFGRNKPITVNFVLKNRDADRDKGRGRGDRGHSPPKRRDDSRAPARRGDDDPKRVWVGGLPDNISESEMQRVFAKIGEIKEINIKFDKVPPFAFVEYEYARDAEESCRELNGSTVLGEPIKVQLPRDGKSKGGSKGGHGDVRPGDWKCNDCGLNNFASRHVCFQCNGPKTGGGGRSRSRRRSRSGDRGGRDVRDVRDDRDDRGGKGKGGGDGGKGLAKDVRPGDWECRDCGLNNFASRNVCFRCNTPKEADSGRGDRSRRPSPRSGQQAPWRPNRSPSRSRSIIARPGRSRSPRRPSTFTVNLEDLPDDFTAAELRSIAGKYGRLVDQDIWVDGRAKAGFLVYDTKPAAEDAIKNLEGRRVDGWDQRIRARMKA